jgi:transcriptional regulator with XRE-family HTH domain
MSHEPVVGDNLPLFGKNLSKIRKDRGLTLEELSNQAKVSISMLSQIEQHKTNPTIAVVWKISKALKISLDELVGKKAEHSPLFESRKKDEAPRIEKNGGCTLRIISPPHFAGTLEIYQATFAPEGAIVSDPHYRGTVEIFTVFKGKIRVVSASSAVELRPGDSVRYSADVSHSIQNLTKQRAEAFLVVYYEPIK